MHEEKPKAGAGGAAPEQKCNEPQSDHTRSTPAQGGRGEITRRPGESGNVYGVSVFVDEYAKWGTACAGRTLGDTVSSKMTKHF